MSSDLYAFDTTFYTHSNSDSVSSDGVGDLPFLSESFPFFANSQENSNALYNSLDPFSPSFFSFSPPSSHLESLSLYHANHVQPLSNGQNLANEFGSFSAFDGSEVKTEECQMGVDYVYGQQLLPHSHSYSGAENFSKYMQRSFSSNSYEGKPAYSDPREDSPKFQRHEMSSPEDNTVFGGQMRRVCSTGDLQVKLKTPRSFFFIINYTIFFQKLSCSKDCQILNVIVLLMKNLSLDSSLRYKRI